MAAGCSTPSPRTDPVWNSTAATSDRSATSRRRSTFPLVDPDAARLPYEDASFDVVILFDVLEHVLDPAAVIKSVRRGPRPTASSCRSRRSRTSRSRSTGSYRRLLGDDLYVETKEHLQAFSEASLRQSSNRSS